MKAREGYVPVHGARLYRREIGAGRPIVVLHGGPDGCTFIGTKGTIHVDRERIEGIPHDILKEPLKESDVHLPVNIGNQDEYTLLQLAETVIEVTGSRSEIVFESLPVDDPKIRQPDITRAKQLLGWEPTVSLRDGLRKTIDEAGVERLVGSPG